VDDARRAEMPYCIPTTMTQLTDRDELSSLAARIRDQLAMTCPRLSEETRAVFAIQIAIAEFRPTVATGSPNELGWLNDLN
jgi:hypothetical protein